MRRVSLVVLVLGLSMLVSSCGGEKVAWDPAVEQSTFTEIEQSLPAARQALLDLDDAIENVPRRQRDEAMEQYVQVRDFVEVMYLYYLPILNARAHIARAYREIDYGMYSEASEDIRKAIDNLSKAALKSTDNTKEGFDVVKDGLKEVSEISDVTAESHMARLSNACRQLNALIEKIRPIIVETEEGELLVDGQF